jgi:hypothetical protein
MKRLATVVIVVVLSGHVHAQDVAEQPNWQPMAGGGPDRLQTTCATGPAEDIGPGVLRVTCNGEEPGFGGFYRVFDGTAFQGQTVRLSGYLKTDRIEDLNGVEGVGSLWIRIEAPSNTFVNNMRARGIKGSSSDWIPLETVETIPDDAFRIWVGFWMQGRGQLWARDISLQAQSPPAE